MSAHDRPTGWTEWSWVVGHHVHHAVILHLVTAPACVPLLPRPRPRSHGVDVVTLGQYMRPTKKHMAVEDFVTPEAFAAYEQLAKVRGRVGGSRGAGGHMWLASKSSRPTALGLAPAPLR